MQRLRFDINAGSSPIGDTGPSINGFVRQIVWIPSTGDTGGNLDLLLAPSANDTGGAYPIYSKDSALGSAFVRALALNTVTPDGFDTGVDIQYPPVAAGERLLVRVTPSQSACVGTLFVYVEPNGR